MEAKELLFIRHCEDAYMDVAIRRIGGRATQEQLPSVSDVAISDYLNTRRKIATLRSQ